MEVLVQALVNKAANVRLLWLAVISAIWRLCGPKLTVQVELEITNAERPTDGRRDM